MIRPRYPIFIPSKGRHDYSLTANFLVGDGLDFTLVVEPQEADLYRAKFGDARVAVLPFSNLGRGSIPARNWIWEEAKRRGAERHWCLDDNIYRIRRMYRGRRVPCAAGPALASLEDFVDRYENIAIAGLAYTFFVIPGTTAALYLNTHVYSCMLIDTSLPQRWRGRYNEDTDLCLQVLSAGHCTILCNVFNAEKKQTMISRGGNTAELYQGDGRLKMARELERVWPGVVRVTRRFKRPQHYVDWTKFRTPLRRKEGVTIDATPNEYGLRLQTLQAVSTSLEGLRAEWDLAHPEGDA